ncbi:MAG: class I SAM-dependent methyltransferase [Rhodospirillaceae bacterium]
MIGQTSTKPRKRGPRDADNHRIATLYTNQLRRFGTTARAVGWRSRDRQEIRFATLAKIGVRQGDSVLDVGCGTGDLCDWLSKRGLRVRYVGLDMVPAMIKHCQTRYPGHNFVLGDLGDPALSRKEDAVDWVLASGLFAHRKEDPFPDMLALVAKMYRICRKGVAFNSLSSAHCPEEADQWELFHADPDQTLLACEAIARQSQPSGRCRLLSGYVEDDFTIHMLKGGK